MADANRLGGLGRLVLWTFNPTPADEVHNILKTMTDDELIYAMTRVGGAAGRIAWATYGARRGFADFEVKVSTHRGKVDLSFTAEAKPIHEGPILGLDVAKLGK